MAEITGTNRNDIITISSVSPDVEGGPASDTEADTVTGALGNDRIETGGGDDVIFGEDDGELGNVKFGADRIIGGDGVDAISGDGFDLTSGAKGAKDRIEGGAGDDELFGDARDIMTDATGGADTINGGADNDLIYGDAVTMEEGGKGGNDILNGGDGDDIIWGDAQNLSETTIGGNDTINGGAGDDLLNGTFGNDKLTGGDGADTFYFNINSGKDQILDFDAADGDIINFSTLVASEEVSLETILGEDNILSAADTGVTVRGGKMTIDVGLIFGTADAKVDTIVIKGVSSIAGENFSAEF